MAHANVSGVTSSTATLDIYDMDTTYPYKRISFLIALPSDSDWTLVETVGDTPVGLYCDAGEYTYTYTGLSSGTEYEFRVIINRRLSYDNFEVEDFFDGTFTTDGGGGGGGDPWVLDSDTYGTISTIHSESVYFDQYTLYRREVSFSSSGQMTFFSTGNIDTIGYFSTDSRWYNGDDEPYSWSVRVDTGGAGDNFSMTRYVSAGTTYYFWFRLADGYDTGSGTIYIQPGSSSDRWEIIDVSAGRLSSSYTDTLSFTPKKIYRISFTVAGSGSTDLYTTSTGDSLDTLGFLSTSTAFDDTTGIPTSVLASNDDGGSGYNCSITYSLYTGTTYYFWVRPNGDDVTGSTVAHIDPPAPAPVQDGGCYIRVYDPLTDSYSWQHATAYVYTSSGWVQATPYVYTSSGWIQTT